MYAYNYGTGNHAYATPQAYAPNSAYGTAPGHATAPPPLAAPAPVPVQTQTRTPTPTAPVLTPVQVPSGCYPIELVQFWRDEYKRDQPFPLHWALFVRTALPSDPSTSAAHGRPRRRPATPTPRGNFYELVGTPETYTAQFLPDVTFEPDTLADWRGTHVIGWVSPAQLPLFERCVRQVPVWRHRPDWRCQHWVYEVVRVVGGCYQGVFMDGVSFGGLQKHMGRLLDAWENGDI